MLFIKTEGCIVQARKPGCDFWVPAYPIKVAPSVSALGSKSRWFDSSTAQIKIETSTWYGTDICI